jgi:hypothetical protein
LNHIHPTHCSSPGEYNKAISRGRAPEKIMIWLVLECVLALSLFLFIIWWTLPRKHKDTNEKATPHHEGTKDTKEHKEDQ